MLNSFSAYLTLTSKKFTKANDVFDIIVYGSSVREKEKPNDIDILLIFLDKELNKRLIIAQKFKEILKKNIKNLDIKTINLPELFDKNFLARQGALVEGYSLLDSIPIARKLGFEGYSLFTYNLKKLDHNKKTKFIYALIGRKNKGMLKLVDAKYLGKGVIAIPIAKSAIFEDFLKKWGIDYKENKILIAI